jgi:hypothetical protein
MKIEDLTEVDVDSTWKVRYILTEEAAISRDLLHNPDTDFFGCEFSSVVCIHPHTGEIADYTYPYAKQESGGWMMTGRVVADWSKVEPISIEKVN